MLFPEIDFFHAEEKKTPAPVSSGHAVARLPGVFRLFSCIVSLFLFVICTGDG